MTAYDRTRIKIKKEQFEAEHAMAVREVIEAPKKAQKEIERRKRHRAFKQSLLAK